jgi:hypothetical protein
MAHTESTHYDRLFVSDLSRHKFRSFAGVGLLDSNGAWVTLFHVTIGFHLHGGLLHSNPLVRLTASSHADPHADPHPKSMLYVHGVAASDPNPAVDTASPASPLSENVVAPSEPVVAPTEPLWPLPPCT